MRFKIKIEIHGQSMTLPINYQYEFSSWIYKLIREGNPDFAEWLHANGYTNEKKQFKLFTFSNLSGFRYKVDGDRIKFLSNSADLVISFYPIELIETFVLGLFKSQEFSIGDKYSKIEFVVKTVERLPEPVVTDQMSFKLISPIHITQKNPFNENKVDHLNPMHKDFEKLFISNLIEKYNAYNEARDFDISSFSLKILSEPIQRLIKIKADKPGETKLTGYLFDFELHSTIELNKIGYYAGFGKSNSLGFGCGEVGR